MANENELMTAADLAAKGVLVEGPVEPEEIVEPPSDAHCPNCNGPGIRKGKTILCEICDCSFRYTKEGPKVEELGPFDELAARVAKLEGSGNVAERTEQQRQADEATERQAAELDRQHTEENAVEQEDDGI